MVVAATAKVPVAIVLPSESMVNTAVVVAPEESVIYNFLAPAASPRVRIMFSVVVAVMSPVELMVKPLVVQVEAAPLRKFKALVVEMVLVVEVAVI